MSRVGGGARVQQRRGRRVFGRVAVRVAERSHVEVLGEADRLFDLLLRVTLHAVDEAQQLEAQHLRQRREGDPARRVALALAPPAAEAVVAHEVVGRGVPATATDASARAATSAGAPRAAAHCSSEASTEAHPFTLSSSSQKGDVRWDDADCRLHSLHVVM